MSRVADEMCVQSVQPLFSLLLCRCKAAQALFNWQMQAQSNSPQQQQQDGTFVDVQERLQAAEHAKAQLGDQALLAKLSALDEHIGKVYAAMQINAVLLVVTGQGDTCHTTWQTEVRIKRQQQLAGYKPWTTAAEESYAAMCESAAKALCFCVVKKSQ